MTTASRFAHAGTTGLTLEALQVGMEAYSKTRRHADLTPIGGVIVECHSGHRGVVEGEIIERPASYTVFDRYASAGHQWHTLEEPDVDLSTVAPAENLGLVVRRLAGELALTKQARGARKRGSSILSGHELSLGRYIGALTKLLGAGVAPVLVVRPKRREDDGEF